MMGDQNATTSDMHLAFGTEAGDIIALDGRQRKMMRSLSLVISYRLGGVLDTVTYSLVAKTAVFKATPT
jgi:hypothetical protein